GLGAADISAEWRERLEQQKADLEMQMASFDIQYDAKAKYADVLSAADLDAYIETQQNTEGTVLYGLTHVSDDIGGWTKDYLLYAVQDAVLNPEGGTVRSDVEPFIFGKMITLRATGSIGSLDDHIEITGGAALIENEMEGLKKLSQANPMDVTWEDGEGDAPGKFVIRGSHEIALEAQEDVTAAASEHVFIAAPTDDLRVNQIEAEYGMIHLTAGGSVVVSEKSTVLAAVKGSGAVFIASGMNKNVGSDDANPLTIAPADRSSEINELRVNAGKSAYIRIVSGDVNLGSIAAREDFHIATSQDGAGIYMSKGQGRLNAADILLVTNGGSIGSSDAPIRVQNAVSSDFSRHVSTIAYSTEAHDPNVWLTGENGTLENGWLNVMSISAKSADIRSQGNMALTGHMTSDVLFVASGDVYVPDNGTGDPGLTGGSIDIRALNGFVLISDDMDLAGRLSLSSDQQDVLVDGSISAGSLRVSALSSIVQSGDMTLSGDADYKSAEKDITITGALSASSDVKMKALSGSVSMNGPITARNLSIDVANAITLSGDVNVVNSATLRSGGSALAGDIILGGTESTLKAGGLTVTAEQGTVTIDSTVQASGDIDTRGAQGVTLNGSVAASGDIRLISRAGAVSIADNLVARSLDIGSAKSIYFGDGLSVDEEIRAKTTDPDSGIFMSGD
ncbi:MAG: hypothetical protein IJ233_03680, partial [Pyramidobacter sp.]|nr:hypothetical protein [Pyramidobacter sp.]